MSPADARTQEKREIAADRRAEWWLLLKALVAVGVVVALVLLGDVHGIGLHGVGR